MSCSSLRLRIALWAMGMLALVFLACREPPPPRPAGLLAGLEEADLRQPIALAIGVGDIDHPVPSANAETRQYYGQGLAYLASFHWLRAARSFHESLRREPRLAAAHLGLARACLGLEAPDLAFRHAAEASRRAAGLSGREKAWIVLGEEQMRAVRSWNQGSTAEHEAFKRALEAHLGRYPDDVDALVLRGNVDPHPGAWGQHGSEGSRPWYERALEIAPDHFPAHHFLAHTYEHLGRYREAQEHARRYRELAPGVPHAHHMLAHVLPRLGAWQEAAAELIEADRLHRQDFAAGVLAPAQDWHYGHNLRLMAAVQLRLGNVSQAEKLYRATFELAYGGRRAGYYCTPFLEYLLSRQRFAEAHDAAATCERRDSQLAGALGAAFRGEALVGLGRLAEARRALRQARQRQRDFLESLRPSASEGAFAFAARTAVDILEGKILLASGDASAGQARLLETAAALGAGPSFDAWATGRIRLEELAGTALRAGQPHLAATLERLVEGSSPAPSG